jgi:DNA repair protein RadC
MKFYKLHFTITNLMQLQEASEWLRKYNRQNESFDLEKEIEDTISQKHFLTKNDLITIVKWKFHKGLEKNRDRVINFIEQMEGSEIEEITREAFEMEEESKKIRKLCKIKGVGISLASCILTFHNPKRYCVFNTHVYDEIFKLETRPNNFFSIPDYYMDLLTEIRKFSEKYNLTVSDVGKALFKKKCDESKSNTTRIKDISQAERPREKLERYGPDSLSNDELLALILRTGHQRENAIEMSNRLIREYGLDKLSECSLQELQQIKGVGLAKACQIIALFEFNKRHNLAVKTKEIVTIEKPEDVYNYFVDELKDKKKEHFYALLLDSKNKIIKKDLISVGTLDSSLVHPREVFKEAIKNSAAGVILVHNHPSGDPEPSDNDVEITQKIANAGTILNIKVLDHVIIAEKGWDNIKINYS